jgi:hypothetical protein
LIEHFYSAHIHSIECLGRLADVLACSQKVSHPEMRLVSAAIGASFHSKIKLGVGRWQEGKEKVFIQQLQCTCIYKILLLYFPPACFHYVEFTH